ncbi:hypothetical protein GCM10025864_12330 [Luteimicrobium album]|uniref:Lipoprotein n=1 Tax=Luteimicrobium album TaxID=1054550 RepID=A0ABQ6I0I6_9MICO|nr:hypothetical protein [Luteimicrobium album]GMA23474.1 hypothetical protein GCM10025864_12330 [Luteimicrobium album]
MTKLKQIAIALPVAAIISALAACSSANDGVAGSEGSGADGSRARLYNSPEDMASDSSAVIVGTVSGTRTVDDIDATTDFTLSDLRVDKVLKGGFAEGASITVRQLGSKEQAPPATLLKPGSEYLLYLTASGLDGDLAKQYYVTGGNAGLYAASANSTASTRANLAADDAGFAQVDPEPGENLPESLTAESALG